MPSSKITQCLIRLLALTASMPLHAVVFDLDFDNHTASTQPDQVITGTGTNYDGLTGMLFTNVAVFENDTPIDDRIDMIFEAITPYSGNTGRNGSNDSPQADSDDIRFNQTFDTVTTYRLSFYDAQTGQLFDNDGNDFTFSLAVIDIDGGYVDGDPFETVQVHTAGDYKLTDNTIVDDLGFGSFSSSNGSTSVDPPPTSGDLSTAQQDATVVLTFTNKSEIEISFGVDRNSNNQQQTGRNLYIDGRGGSALDGYDPTTDLATGQVPEPASYAVLVSLCALGITLGARRRR